jgi:hypothetical protein
MTTPQRIQLSRRKGFDLQAASLALNGLPAVVVARPSKFGNPFRLDGTWQESFRALALVGDASKASRRAAVIELHRLWLTADWSKAVKPGSEDDKRTAWQREVMTVQGDRKPPTVEEIRRELGGKNLACWCPPGPCHADVLLKIAKEER